MSLSFTFILGGLIGLLGSLHCVGMCGGLMASVSLALPKSLSPQRRGLLILCMMAGRIAMYVMLGLTLSLMTYLLVSQIAAQFLLILRYISATLMILIGVYLLGYTQGLHWLERGLFKWLAPIKHRLHRQTRLETPVQAIRWGLGWGLMPCGLVYSSAAIAATDSSLVSGMVFMLAFGLGTLPMVLSGVYFFSTLKTLAQDRGVQRFMATILIVSGLWTGVAAFYVQEAILDGRCTTMLDTYQQAFNWLIQK